MRASWLKQVQIYTGKCFRVFHHEKGWKVFLSSAIITMIICTVLSEDMFVTQSDTRNGAFALVCACIWIGIFNSIQSICKERDIIKREHRSGLKISAYLCAHAIFEMFLCLVEAVIVTIIICAFNWENLPESGVFLPIILELFITFFITIASSDTLGMLVSSIVKTPNTAMTVMPFVLIIQLVMSGMIFKLSGITETIAKFTISKWSLEAICVSADLNSLTNIGIPLEEEAEQAYEYVFSNLAGKWGLMLLFLVLYVGLSTMFLSTVDRDKR